MAEELDRGEEDSSARLDAETVRGLLERLLPSLFKLVDTLHTGTKGTPAGDGESESGAMDVSYRVHAVTEAIAAMARLSPAPLLNTLSSKLIQRLLEASQSEEDLSIKVCSLLTLAQALVMSETLEDSTISLLYRSLKPLIRTDETRPRVQKRAYKLLAEICSRNKTFVSDKTTLKELLELLTSTSGTSQTSARSARLKCLTCLVNAFDDAEKQNEVRCII
jgi:ribosomal RNA-processing protein 12